MNVLFSSFRKFANLFRRSNDDRNEVVIEVPVTVSRKRQQDENVPEILTKRRKTTSENYLAPEFATAFAADALKKSTHVKRQKRDRLRGKKPLNVIDITKSAEPCFSKQNIYCIDDEENDVSQRQENVSQEEESSIRKEANNWRKVNGNIFAPSATSFIDLSHSIGKRSPLCLNQVHKEQEVATLLEMVRKYAPSSVHARRSVPLTTSTMHNTNKNRRMFNDLNRTSRSYQSAQSVLMNSTMMDSTRVSSEPKIEPGIIDLTTDDEDDESQRQIIEANVKNLPEIQHFKSSFVAKDSPVADPEYLIHLTKKYEQKRHSIGSRVQRLQKTMQKHNEEFNKSLAEYLEKRLTLKEHTEPEVEHKPSREIAPITPAMKMEIANLRKNPPGRLKPMDIDSLDDSRWLNDEVINAYMDLIILRSKNDPDRYPKVYCFNTYLYEKYSQPTGYSGVRRWTKKVDIFSYEILIIPIHLSNHWCLIEVRFAEKQILYYDSLGSPNTRCLDRIMQYLVSEYQDKKNDDQFNSSGWDLINVPIDEIPRQTNSSDCGVFACTYAEHRTRNSLLNFDQSDMPYFRDKMKYELLTEHLLL